MEENAVNPLLPHMLTSMDVKGVGATHLIIISIVVPTAFLKRSVSLRSVLPRGVLQDVSLIIPG